MKTFLLGGGGDIGGAIKTELESHRYVVTSPTRDELDLGERHSAYEYFMDKLNDFQVIIYCAGYNNPRFITEYKDIDYITNVNITSFYKIIQQCLPNLRKYDRSYVLGISSLYGVYSREGRSLYSMNKHAMEGFIKTLALEEGENGVLANVIRPGIINTKMTRKNNKEDYLKELSHKIPLGRLGEAEEVAKLAYFLCSVNNSYITGQAITIDGGITAGV